MVAAAAVVANALLPGAAVPSAGMAAGMAAKVFLPGPVNSVAQIGLKLFR